MTRIVPGSVVTALRDASAAVLNLLVPDQCRICNRPLTEFSRIPVCRDCLQQPQPLDADYFCSTCRTPFRNDAPLDEQGRCPLCRLGLRGFDAGYSFGAYEGTLRELIHVFKYGRVRTLAKPLGKLLASAIPLDERFDLVVPVPLHWRRRLQRGFNQSALLSAFVARRYGVPVATALRRRKPTASQAGLSNSRRRANVAGAFAVRRGARLENRRILLVDDVLTTGATAGACSAALKRAGARYVAVLTLARVDRRATLDQFPAARAAAAGAI